MRSVLNSSLRGVSAFCLALILVGSTANAQNEREKKVRGDRENLQNDDLWIYNDLDAAVAEAKKSNRPLLVVFRCIPCEACSRFDKELLARPAEVKDLLNKFVCVRIVQGNHLDLALFQFDYDQSFHMMFLNADRTIYGRYGTRSSRPEEEDMTIAGLRQAMLRVLDLQEGYPANKDQLAAKTGAKPEFVVPENMPQLKGKYGPLLNYEGEVVKSCIHCHQIRDAQRQVYRERKETLPDDVLYPFPLPDSIGLRMDPNHCAKIAAVAAGSYAEQAKLKAGDEILTANGQPLISIADLQWVLHQLPNGSNLNLLVRRGAKEANVEVEFPRDWKKQIDISWRVTTWPLRGVALGGMVLESLPEGDRPPSGIEDDQLALRIKRVGQYGIHATARNAGFRQGDILISVNGDTKPQTESTLLAQLLTLPTGTKVPITLLRDGKRMELKLPIQ